MATDGSPHRSGEQLMFMCPSAPMLANSKRVVCGFVVLSLGFFVDYNVFASNAVYETISKSNHA